MTTPRSQDSEYWQALAVLRATVHRCRGARRDRVQRDWALAKVEKLITEYANLQEAFRGALDAIPKHEQRPSQRDRNSRA